MYDYSVHILHSNLQGCVYIMDAYKVYWTSCVKGYHTGHMVLRLVEAIGIIFRILFLELLYVSVYRICFQKINIVTSA